MHVELPVEGRHIGTFSEILYTKCLYFRHTCTGIVQLKAEPKAQSNSAEICQNLTQNLHVCCSAKFHLSVMLI